MADTVIQTESMVGAAIDALRIQMMIVRGMVEAELVVETAEMTPLENALAQAHAWLDKARAISMEGVTQPPSSIHVVKGGIIGG